MEGETEGPAVAGSLFLVLLLSSILVSYFIGRYQKFNLPEINSSQVMGASTINTADSFKITKVDLSVDSSQKFGCLYNKFNFYGQITSNGPGVASYSWEGSNNSSMTPILIKFDSAETKYISTGWQVYGPGNRSMELHVNSPSEIESPKVPFEVVCK